MLGKGQWVVLPYLLVKELMGLRLILLGVKEERDRRPRCLGNYSNYNIISYSLPKSVMSSIQYVRSLNRPIRDVVISDTSLGPIYVLKEDVSYRFYCIALQPEDAPKPGLAFTLDV